MYAQLLLDLFKFLNPFMRNAELTKPILFLYKVRQAHLPCHAVLYDMNKQIS